MDIGCVGTPFEFKFLDTNGAAAGTFEGYGAVFGNIDSHGDVIEPGAFAKSLLERERSGRRLPPMYKQHGLTGVGRDPVGVWDAMSEDANGLHVKGRLIGLDTEQGKFTYAQAKEGAIGGLSIGYKVMPNGSRNGSGKAGEPRRFLKMLHLGEVSLVDDPSNARARVHAMKAAFMAGDEAIADEIKTIREFEKALHDFFGFSNAKARAIAENGFKSFDEDEVIREALSPIDDLVRIIRAAG